MDTRKAVKKKARERTQSEGPLKERDEADVS
jgi:hypothetical protein